MHLADLTSHLEADGNLCALYADRESWARKAILNVASSGKFSSDRTIAEYAADICMSSRARCRDGACDDPRHQRRRPRFPRWPASRPRPLLIDLARLERDYYERKPDAGRPEPARQLRHQRPPRHVAATAPSPRPTSSPSPRPSASTAQPRASTGPLFMGKDTHALSGPAQRTALEVLAANGVETVIQQRRRLHADAGHLARHPRPQPRPQASACADGIVITPSHNPPERRRLQVQPAQRRPGRHRRHRRGSRTAPTSCCAAATPASSACRSTTAAQGGDDARSTTSSAPYVDDLRNVIDMDAIRGRRRSSSASIRSAARRVHYWEPIADVYGLDIDGRQPAGRSDVRVHDASTTTARSAWTAPAPTRWPAWSG